MTTQKNTIGIIAGAGSFPIEVAREAGREGISVVGFGLTGWVDPGLAKHVAVYEEIDIGQLGSLIARLKAHGIREAVMAGKVTKQVLFDPRIQFDAVAIGVIGGLKEYTVNGVLGAIGQRLAQEGVTLQDSSRFLQDSLCPVGVLTDRKPTAEEQDDIRRGAVIARQLAEIDIGQTVILKRSVIVAVEALEGTDAAIKRAGEVGGAGCVLVKMGSPTQDRRFDLPVLGPHTIATAAAAKLSCIAVEAGTALLLDKAALLAQANAAGICLVGIEPATAA